MQVERSLTTTQIGVLKYLKQNGTSSAKQMASAFGVTVTSVRTHLKALEQAALVAVTLDRQGAGRPVHVYSLTGEARTVFPNDYEAFIGGFIRAAVELFGEDKLELVFKRMRTKARILYASQMTDQELESRVSRMTQILNDSGYMAEWRRTGKDTFELTEHNCSIWQVAAQCPEVCTCELSLIRQLLDASVDRQAHMIEGDSVCRYRIQQKRAPTSKAPSRTRRPTRTNPKRPLAT